MSNEKHYDHYVVNAKESAAVYATYSETVADKRKAVQLELLDKTGAIAWREQSSWGKADFICELVYPADSSLINHPHIKIGQRDKYDGMPVVSVRGKMNSKAGIAFNMPIHKANLQLETLPDFADWLVHTHYKVNRTGMGGTGPRGHGTCMLSTSGGFATHKRERLVFRVPNDPSERHGEVDIPASFEKITYGTWHDLTSGEQS